MATLSNLRQYVTDRKLELTTLIGSINDSGLTATSSYSTQIKGLFFVSLYAILEHTLVECIQEALKGMEQKSPKKSDIKSIVLSVALDAEASAIANCGPKKVWEKRVELFASINSQDKVAINTSAMPIPGGNIEYQHILFVWKVFEIPVSLTITPSLGMRITTVTGHRNAIGHGRETSTEVGRRYTKADIEKFLDDYDKLCENVIDAFQDYIDNERYIEGN